MNDNCSFKIEYKLKQQTPLIHFQYDQAGATLRATEVKPKFDRFIIKRMGGIENVPQEWRIDSDKSALNYKMRIVALESQVEELGFKTDYDIFYGNIGDNKKKGVISSKITLTIICMNTDLMDAIKKHICNFFIVTNFGTMQNKGFGSFIIDGCDINDSNIAKALKEEYQAKACYMFTKEKPFKAIKNIYSIMKSGINHDGYQRSLLFLYMHTKNIGNEKAWLKQMKIAPAIGKNTYHSNPQNHGPKYVRALLGVGDHIDFKNTIGTSDDEKKDKTEVKISCKEIERLESCIFFKVLNKDDKYTVFIIAKPIHEEIFNKKFIFTSKPKEDRKINKNYVRKWTPQINYGELCTPDSFDVDEFLKFCFVNKMYENNGLINTYFKGITEVK